jgi:hypothetical protein
VNGTIDVAQASALVDYVRTAAALGSRDIVLDLAHTTITAPAMSDVLAGVEALPAPGHVLVRSPFRAAGGSAPAPVPDRSMDEGAESTRAIAGDR